MRNKLTSYITEKMSKIIPPIVQGIYSGKFSTAQNSAIEYVVNLRSMKRKLKALAALE